MLTSDFVKTRGIFLDPDQRSLPKTGAKRDRERERELSS